MAKSRVASSGRVVASMFGEGPNIVIGTLIRIDGDGVPYVDFAGNPHGELAARIVGDAGTLRPALDAPEVALAFEGGNPTRPLILGVVSSRLDTSVRRSTAADSLQKELFIDGQRVRISADSELQLRCGQASILLRSDGKLIIKGAEVLSRASGTNKIKGGHVNIN